MSLADRRDLRRPKTLSRSISRQCHCSKRSIYLLDPHYSLPTDDDINAFLDQYSPHYPPRDQYSPHYPPRVEVKPDCDDHAREDWCQAKTWFWTQRQQNVAFGFLLRASTPTQKAHALNFYVRPDMFLRFLDRGERVPLGGRAYLVLI